MAKNIVFGLLLVGISRAGFCVALADRPLPEIFAQSKSIVVADVVSIEGRCEGNSQPCRASFVYELVPSKIIKGNMIVGNPIKVCSLSTIQLDSNYVLFIESTTKWNGREDCKYSSAIDSDGVFKQFGDDYYRLGSPMSQMILHGYGQTYYSNAILVSDFEKDLTALTQQIVTETKKAQAINPSP